MKKILLSILIFMAVTNNLFSQKDQKTIVFSGDGKFEVTFPKLFTNIGKDIKDDISNSGKLVMLGVENETGACLVSYNDYSADAIKSKKIEDILESAVGGYIDKESVVYSKNFVTIAGLKGLSIKFESKSADGKIMYSRFDCTVNKTRFYQVAFVGYKKSSLDRTDINEFFNSFKISNYSANEYKSEEGKFIINLPDKFTNIVKKTVPVETEAGNLDMIMYSEELSDGMVLIAHNEYPSEVFEKKGVDKILSDALDGALKAMKAKLVSQSQTFRENLPGLSFICESGSGKNKIYSRYDYVLKNPLLYQIAYLAYDVKELQTEQVLNYFKSFRLIEEK